MGQLTRILIFFTFFSILISAQDYYGQRSGMSGGGPQMPVGIFAECRWFGSGPFCDGECPLGYEATGHSKGCDEYNDHPACGFIYFGSSCWTGHKILCCPEGFASGCNWYGTAPFCDGECPRNPGWIELHRRDNCEDERFWPCSVRDFGEGCSTGVKAYCCPTPNMPPPPPPPMVNDDYYG